MKLSFIHIHLHCKNYQIYKETISFVEQSVLILRLDHDGSLYDHAHLGKSNHFTYNIVQS